MIGFKNGNRILVNAHTKAIGMGSDRGHQTCHAIAVMKMLIDNNFRQNIQACTHIDQFLMG